MGSMFFWAVVVVSIYFGRLAGEFAEPYIVPQKLHRVWYWRIGVGLIAFVVLLAVVDVIVIPVIREMR